MGAEEEKFSEFFQSLDEKVQQVRTELAGLPAAGGGGGQLSRKKKDLAIGFTTGRRGRGGGGAGRTSQNLAPIWFPHWPPWM